jgi:1,4-dihydroxy-2-naphthoate polyprenyltransferase
MISSPNSSSTINTFLHAWWLGIRPKTLPASIAGVVTGIALAIHDNKFHFGPALAALGVGVLLQIASNLANDVFDFEHGTDTDERLGPTRVTQAGMLAPRQVKIGLIIAVGLAIVLGIYLAFIAGWPVILIGLAAIASAILYTGGPFPLGYHGLGDLFVFLFFGLAAVAGTYFVQTGRVEGEVWWMAVSIGLLVVNLLVVNNLRDIPTDRKAGKFTMAILLGERGSRWEYVLFQGIAYGIVLVMVLLNALPVWALLSWLSIPMAYRAARIVLTQDGRQLNPALGKTSQLAFIYGFLLLAGIIISKIG